MKKLSGTELRMHKLSKILKKELRKLDPVGCTVKDEEELRCELLGIVSAYFEELRERNSKWQKEPNDA